MILVMGTLKRDPQLFGNSHVVSLCLFSLLAFAILLRRFWESSCSALGPFAELSFRPWEDMEKIGPQRTTNKRILIWHAYIYIEYLVQSIWCMVYNIVDGI